MLRSQLLYPLSYGRVFVLKESTKLDSAFLAQRSQSEIVAGSARAIVTDPDLAANGRHWESCRISRDSEALPESEADGAVRPCVRKYCIY
jgi:hypothetical protein